MNRNAIKVIAVVVIGIGFFWRASATQSGGREQEYPYIAATIGGGALLFAFARMLAWLDRGRSAGR
jgi:hypothetical protein